MLVESGVSFTNASCSRIEGLVRSGMIMVLSADGKEGVADARKLVTSAKASGVAKCILIWTGYFIC